MSAITILGKMQKMINANTATSINLKSEIRIKNIRSPQVFMFSTKCKKQSNSSKKLKMYHPE